MDFEKFTDRSKGFVQAAQTIASREHHQRIVPAHLLKALLDDEQGMAAGLIGAAGGDGAAAKVLDYIRKEERLRALHGRQAEEIEEAQPEQATGTLDRADRIRLVLEHVAGLDEAERDVLVLRLQEGLSYEEIARITGRTVGNVGCLLHHAVKNMARELKKIGAI